MNLPGRPMWFEREFPSGLPLEMLPNLIERLRSGPAAYSDRVRGLHPDDLVWRVDDKWSVQENIGHVLDLEQLWLGRVEDFVNGAETLRPTDLANTRSHEANHNLTPVEGLLKRFRNERIHLVEKFESLTDEILNRNALHPRLKTPMNVADLAYFVAEHDIHHLVRINELLKK